MNPLEALDEVRKDLTHAFGDALATRIMDAACNTAPREELNAASYRDLIASLCRDERVRGMFGELGVKDKQQRWEKLV
jgi:hypothetical protein